MQASSCYRDSSTETRPDLRASHPYEEATHKSTAHKATEESQHWDPSNCNWGSTAATNATLSSQRAGARTEEEWAHPVEKCWTSVVNTTQKTMKRLNWAPWSRDTPRMLPYDRSELWAQLFMTGMLSRPGPAFKAVSRACGGGSPQPSKPQRGARAFFPTPQRLHLSYGKLQLFRSNYWLRTPSGVLVDINATETHSSKRLIN